MIFKGRTTSVRLEGGWNVHFLSVVVDPM